MECDFGFIVNRVLNETDSLTQLKIKTKCSFNEYLIRLKRLIMEYHQFCSMGYIGWDWEIKQIITSVWFANPD